MCYSFTTKFNYVKHLKTSSDTLNIINLWFRPCAYRMIDKKAHTHTHTRKEQINPILYSSNLRLWTIINTCVIQKQWIPQQSSKREYFPFVFAIWDVCFFYSSVCLLLLLLFLPLSFAIQVLLETKNFAVQKILSHQKNQLPTTMVILWPWNWFIHLSGKRKMNGKKIAHREYKTMKQNTRKANQAQKRNTLWAQH